MENADFVLTGSSFLAADSGFPAASSPVQKMELPSSGSERKSDSPNETTKNETADSSDESVSTYHHSNQISDVVSERTYDLLTKSPHYMYPADSSDVEISKSFAAQSQPSAPPVDVSDSVSNADKYMDTLDGHLGKYQDHFTASVQTINQSTNYDLNQYAPEYSSKPSDGESGSLPHENQTEEPRDQSCNAVTARGKNSTSPSLDDKCVVNSAGGRGDFLDQDSSVHTEEEQTKINSENSGCDSNVLTDFSSYAVNMCDDDTKRSEPTPDNRYQIDNQNNNLISHFNEEGNNGNMIEQSNTAQNCQQTNGQSFLNRHPDFQPMAFAVPDSAQRTVGSNNKKTEERTQNHVGLMRNITLIHQNNYSGVGHYDVTQSNNQPFQYQQHQPSSYELEPHHSNQQEEVDRSQHQHFQMHSYFHHQQHNNQSTLQHMHEDLHCYSGSTPTSQIHPHPHAIPRIDDVVMEDDHHKRHPSGFKLLSPVVKGENDDGYETSIGDNLTPNSRTSSSSTSSTASLPPVNPHHLGQTNLLTLSSGPLHNLSSSGGLIPKIRSPEQRSMNSSLDNSYNYLKDEMDGDVQMTPGSLIENTMSGRQHGYPQMLIRCPGETVGHVDNGDIMPTASDCGPLAPLQLSTNTNIEDGGAQSLPSNVITSLNQSTIPEVFPTKKRGRKKKVGNENGSNHHGILKPIGAPKERKKHDRFNGMSEEEVSKRTLPDHLTDNLDIIIIGINPGLFAAYKGHHYAGPGNHFWKCLYLSGLIHEQMTAEEDYKLLDFGIGFTNIVERTTKGSADLTRKEIKEGCRILMEKLRKFQPKIAVFNGKLIYEVFSGKKDFHFGRQDDFVDGTSTYMWVMPSSSARCAQLPRAADKVPFYAALKKFRDYLNGLIPRIDDNECIFNDPKYKACCETEPKKKNLIYKDISHLSNCNLTTNLNNDHDINMLGNALDSEKEVLQNAELNSDFSIAPGKKKRGRPKKVKCVGDLLTAGGNLNMRAENSGSIAEFSSTPLHLSSGYNNDNLSKFTNLTAPKKKRGRPKKIKVAAPQIPANNDCIELVANSNSFLEDQMLEQTSNRNEIDNGNGHRNVQNSISSATDGVNHDLSNNDGTHTGRVFSSLKHSPSTADSSYCSPAMNAPLSSRPSVDFDSNMTGNCFHQQHEHQLALQSQRYDEHMHTHSSYQPNYSTHSDLSSEISAAIAADHLGESAASASPNAASGPYNSSTRIQMSESNINDIRYSSPSAINDRHRKPFNYDTYDSSPDRRFLSGNNNNANEENTHDHYISNQQSTTDLTGGQQTQQLSDVSSKSLSGLESLVHQIPSISSDMPQQTQPQLSNSDSPSRPEHLHRSSIPHALNDFSCGDHCSSSCLYSHYASSLQHQLPPISPASKILSVSCCSTPSAGLISPHQHYATAVALYSPDNGANVNTPCQVSVSSPSSSSSSPLPLATTRNSRNNSSGSFNYTNLVSNSFSVSSLTSGEHPDAYRRNFISTPPSHSHLNASLGCNNGSGSVNNSPMYMEQPQILLPVSSLYHHHHNPYAQHPVYPRYSASPHPLPSGVSSSATSSPSPVQSPIPQLHHPAQPTHPTIHMPSPNYPYGYPNVGGYSQAHHHTVHHASVHHPSAAGYLPSHASMFDRLKSDFGYGGF